MASVDALQIRRQEVKKRLRELETLLPQAQEAAANHRSALNSRSWFRRTFDDKGRKQLMQLAQQAFQLRKEEKELQRELTSIEGQLRWTRESIRHKAAPKEAAELRSRRAQIEEERLRAFAATSMSAIEQPFQRDNFVIQKADYRRGNRIDNYCRRRFGRAIVQAFGGQCACCGGIEGLTLDHYGLTKNEGGNFVLITKGSGILRVNLVVLCRSCNAAKAQLPHDLFFGAEQRQVIVGCQEKVLSTVIADGDFRALIMQWSKGVVSIPTGSLGRNVADRTAGA